MAAISKGFTSVPRCCFSLLSLTEVWYFGLWFATSIKTSWGRNFPSTGVKAWEVRGSALLHSCSVFTQRYFNCVAPFSDCKNHHKMHPTGGTFLRLWERAGVPRDGSLREASVHRLITNHYCHLVVDLRTASKHLMSWGHNEWCIHILFHWLHVTVWTYIGFTWPGKIKEHKSENDKNRHLKQ